MKICFYTDTFFPWVGGAETVLHHVASELAGQDHTIVVLAPAARGAEDDQYPYEVIRYRKPFSRRFGVELILPRLRALQGRYQFDIIHCHATYPPGFVALKLREQFNVPIVVRPHGSDLLSGHRIRDHPRLRARLVQTLQNADAVIAMGEYIRQAVLDCGVHHDRVHVIHNGVDLSEFSRGGNYAHPRPYVLGMGTLKPRKGFDILLRAFAMIDEPSHDLLIAGSGKSEESLKTLARELKIDQRVRFVGQVRGQPKVDLLRSAEFFVFPSRSEPLGNVMLEAFASGLPVVGARTGGIAELVEDGERGLLWESENPEALAAALRRMLDDPQLVKRLSEGASRFIRDYDWPVVANRFLDLYRQLTGDDEHR